MVQKTLNKFALHIYWKICSKEEDKVVVVVIQEEDESTVTKFMDRFNFQVFGFLKLEK